MAGLSRRTLCAALIALPAATLITNLPAVSAEPLALMSSGAGIPSLIRRVVEVVAQNTGVSAQAIMARMGGPEVHAAHRKALFLSSSLTYDVKSFAMTCRHLGVPHPWIGLAIMRKAASEVDRDPMGVETVLELAGQVHRDAPGILLGDIPAYDLEAGYRA